MIGELVVVAVMTAVAARMAWFFLAPDTRPRRPRPPGNPFVPPDPLPPPPVPAPLPTGAGPNKARPQGAGPRANEAPHQDPTFGFKCGWLAVRTGDPAAVISALALHDVREVSWPRGVDAAYEGAAFVTSPVDGWVLVASTGWIDRVSPRLPAELANLSERLGAEVQLFVTFRITELHAWMRAEGGRVTRGYASTAERGEVWFDGGPLTDVERELGLTFDPDPEPVWRAERAVPEDFEHMADEDHVMRVARAWSVDPTTIPADYAARTGYVGSWETP